MKRLLYYNLQEWLKSYRRKPLIIFGARQVGKTHLIRMLSQHMPNFVEINLERQEVAGKVFTADLDPKRIIRELSLIADKDIIPGKTLLFLDEIQETSRAIIALRYFYEEMPELHVIAAGSLLDFAIEQVGVPVGRVTFRYLYPMSFIEFLVALDHQRLAKAIVEQPLTEPISEVIHDKATNLLGQYMAIGGMPEVVSHWRDLQNIKNCQAVQREIIASYEQDFSKYAKERQIKYVDHLFKQLPRHIAKKFKYPVLQTPYRKRELEPALHLLEKARIINFVYHTHGNGLLLGAEADFDKFKIFMLDVALTQAILGLDIKEWFLDSKQALINKGEIAEAFIGQELLAYADPQSKTNLYYWHREAKGSNAEVDYLHNYQNKVIPIEVKSGHGAGLQSMRLYLKKHLETPFGIRFAAYNYSFVDQIQTAPLYAVAAFAKDNPLIGQLCSKA